jgi:hypothetical protein
MSGKFKRGKDKGGKLGSYFVDWLTAIFLFGSGGFWLI